MVATPAANAGWLPRKVPECAPGFQTSSFSSYRITEAGRPMPDRALEAHTTSGSMPYCSNANQVPVRPQPLCTSSTMSGMPRRRVTSRIRWTNSTSAGMTPPSPCTSSMITAAGRVIPALTSVSAFSRNAAQLTWQLSRLRPSGQLWQLEYGKKCTPGIRPRTGSFCSTRPVTLSAARVAPWKPPWKVMISSRPVAVLHSLRAASTALAPVGPQKWIRVRSRIGSGSIPMVRSVNSSLTGVGKSRPCTNSSSWRCAAVSGSGWLWPRDSTPAPLRKSRKTFPSRSST